MKRYFKSTNPWGSGVKRMVNQPEIHHFILNNPGKTEDEIMYEIYGYIRGGWGSGSNKKYADRLRDLLGSGKISRVKAQLTCGKRYIYFAVSKELNC